VELRRFEHPVFTSNTFVLFEEGSDTAFVVDIGEYNRSRSFLEAFSNIPILFITHAHYDHIYHINEFLIDYPECQVYASSYALECLASPKRNLSFYHDDPVSYKGSAVFSLKGKERIRLTDNTKAEVMATPGHTVGCLSFKIGKYFFTGDSFIPGYKVVTKLKGGNKLLSKDSLTLIKETLTPGMVLCPGHGPIYAESQIAALSAHLEQ
jgi:glyoxylase-like metal-dependent hydrolase (beta-lactamase superfamily II)